MYFLVWLTNHQIDKKEQCVSLSSTAFQHFHNICCSGIKRSPASHPPDDFRTYVLTV